MYTSHEIVLTHERLVELREAGDLNLGIDNDFAARLASERGLGPKKNHGKFSVPFLEPDHLGRLCIYPIPKFRRCVVVGLPRSCGMYLVLQNE